MAGNLQSIQFPHQGHRWPGATTTEHCLDTSQPQPAVKFQAQVTEDLLHLFGCAVFLEPQFGVIHDRLAHADDPVTILFDRLADGLFQCSGGRHGVASRVSEINESDAHGTWPIRIVA